MNGLSAAVPRLLAPLNEIVVPMVKLGVGAPWLTPLGLIVLQVAGRRTGRLYTLPLLAAAVVDLVVVSTVRGDAAWVKNLRAAGGASIWLRGRQCRAELVGALTVPAGGACVMMLRVATAAGPT
jgi:hypothetical protein